MRAFITGISSGIGRALCQRLIQDGQQVWGVARREAGLEQLTQQLNSPRFRYSVCDVASEEAVREVYQHMASGGYVPDTFILNAAVDVEDPLPHLSADISRDTLRTNLEGALIWVDLFIDHCLERENCQLIAVSSLFAHWPDTSNVAYAASKAGLTWLSEASAYATKNTKRPSRWCIWGPSIPLSILASLERRCEEIRLGGVP